MADARSLLYPKKKRRLIHQFRLQPFLLHFCSVLHVGDVADMEHIRAMAKDSDEKMAALRVAACPSIRADVLQAGGKVGHAKRAHALLRGPEAIVTLARNRVQQ